jgi:hypothetical protein
VSSAFLNGNPVTGPFGEQEVCPASTTTYTLHVINLDGSTEDRTVTVTVIDTTGPYISGLEVSEELLHNENCDYCSCETDVDVNVTDPSGVAEVELVYIKPGETTERTKLMANIGGDSYNTTLNSDPWNSGTLEFWTRARDNKGNISESSHRKMDVKACVI